jgi:hypothetical protein
LYPYGVPRVRIPPSPPGHRFPASPNVPMEEKISALAKQVGRPTDAVVAGPGISGLAATRRLPWLLRGGRVTVPGRGSNPVATRSLTSGLSRSKSPPWSRFGRRSTITSPPIRRPGETPSTGSSGATPWRRRRAAHGPAGRRGRHPGGQVRFDGHGGDPSRQGRAMGHLAGNHVQAAGAASRLSWTPTTRLMSVQCSIPQGGRVTCSTCSRPGRMSPR